MQLEAEVARLERVRAVWLDTRRNLQVERHFTEDESDRTQSRCAQWEQAAKLVARHTQKTFQVAAGMNSERFNHISERAKAGAAVRKLVHEYERAAGFERKRLRGVVARYRGLDLVVQAHAVFAAELSLALPDGTLLDTITASTDSGIWQSVGHTVGEIPAIVERLRGRVAEADERIATIDRELIRLETWDGQATYDVAVSELHAINAAFAAEEQASTECLPVASESEAAASPTAEGAPDDGSLAELLLALAQEECAADGWNLPPTIIPPAPASLALMASKVERGAVACTPCREPLVAAEPDIPGETALDNKLGLFHTSRKTPVQSSDALAQRRMPKPEVSRPPHREAEVHQLPLF